MRGRLAGLAFLSTAVSLQPSTPHMQRISTGEAPIPSTVTFRLRLPGPDHEFSNRFFLSPPQNAPIGRGGTLHNSDMPIDLPTKPVWVISSLGGLRSWLCITDPHQAIDGAL
jgi:hypothetical protein